jgi:hypothetical protein
MALTTETGPNGLRRHRRGLLGVLSVTDRLVGTALQRRIRTNTVAAAIFAAQADPAATVRLSRHVRSAPARGYPASGPLASVTNRS